MQSRIKILGHPVHPMLIVFPLGLLATSFVFDIIYLLVSDGRTFAIASFYMISAGLVGGVAAAIFGVIDWLSIPRDTRAWRVGLFHGAGNVLVVLLFLISWFARLGSIADPGVGPVVLSFLGVTCALVTGWLGGELVYRLAVGIDPNASTDAASSLGTQRQPAVGPANPNLGQRVPERSSFPGR